MNYELLENEHNYILQPVGNCIDDRKIKKFSKNDFDSITEVLEWALNYGWTREQITIK